MIRLLKVEVEGKKLRWLYFMNVILFFFFFSCSRSCTNINEYEHLKKRPSANVNRGGSRGKVRSGRGGGGTEPPPIRTVGTFTSYLKLWFLQRQDGILLLNFQGWNIYLAYSGSCVRKKNESKIKPFNQKIPGSNSASLHSDMLTSHITLWPSGRF